KPHSPATSSRISTAERESRVFRGNSRREDECSREASELQPRPHGDPAGLDSSAGASLRGYAPETSRRPSRRSPKAKSDKNPIVPARRRSGKRKMKTILAP